MIRILTDKKYKALIADIQLEHSSEYVESIKADADEHIKDTNKLLIKKIQLEMEIIVLNEKIRKLEIDLENTESLVFEQDRRIESLNELLDEERNFYED